MSFEAWQAIARRHVQYRTHLEKLMKEWPEDRVDSCKDMTVLESIIKLTERVERHQLRMQRHSQRALAYLEIPGGQKH